MRQSHLYYWLKSPEHGCRRERVPNNDGFTLIELLVVISIIALLVGILLPALGAARKSAMSAVCLSNNRQIGVGFFSYATNEDGYLPPVGIYDGGGFQPVDYFDRLSPYFGYSEEEQLGLDYLADPVEPRPAPPPFDANPNTIHGGVGYGMHYLGVTAYQAAPGFSHPFAIGSKRIEDLNLTLFMYGDAAGAFIYAPTFFKFNRDRDKDGIKDTNTSFGLDPLYNRFDPRHNGSGNMLIADGSAKSVSVDAYVSNEGDIWDPLLLGAAKIIP